MPQLELLELDEEELLLDELLELDEEELLELELEEELLELEDDELLGLVPPLELSVSSPPPQAVKIKAVEMANALDGGMRPVTIFFRYIVFFI